MATIAVFIALGGTSYALTLPRNSVGSAQLRSDSVGRSELRDGAVRSSTIGDRSIRLRDISQVHSQRHFAARPALGVPPVPSSSLRSTPRANWWQATRTSHGPGGAAATVVGFSPPSYRLRRDGDAYLAARRTEPRSTGNRSCDRPTQGDGGIRVETWRTDGQPVPYPFNLIVAC